MPANRNPHPIPTDPAEQQQWARSLAHRVIVPQSLVAKATALRRPERVAAVFPEGVRQGVNMALQLADAKGLRLPAKFKSAGDPAANAWAQGVAAGITIPPQAAFSRTAVAATIAIIYRAGIERGILLTLQALDIHDRGGSS